MSPALPRPLLIVLAATLACTAARADDCAAEAATAPRTQAADADAPRLSLLALVQAAERRSKAIGAAQWLADAARSDLEETKAAAGPQATLNAQVGPAGSQGVSAPMVSGLQVRPAVSLSMPLYDAGRQDHLTRWREDLAEAARLGQLSASEQVALQTVTLAFDRSRYRLHAQVYGQYAQAVCQLARSLEEIVQADRGRASELVQARKTLQQVQLSRTQAQSQLRLTETKLRRLVGDALPDDAGLGGTALQWRQRGHVHQQRGQAADIAQLSAQRDAAASLAQATAAGQKPQAGWVLSASRNLVGDHTAAWNAGVSLSMPLWSPGAEPAAQAARQRAEAARLQRDEALDNLQHRLAEVHEQADAAMHRARDVVAVLKDSQRLRDDTQQMWRQLGRRSLFDVMSAEGDHFSLRLAYVDALHDGQQAVALLWSLAGGVVQPLR